MSNYLPKTTTLENIEKATNSLDMNNNHIINLKTPENDFHSVNKKYVDDLINNLSSIY